MSSEGSFMTLSPAIQPPKVSHSMPDIDTTLPTHNSPSSLTTSQGCRSRFTEGETEVLRG